MNEEKNIELPHAQKILTSVYLGNAIRESRKGKKPSLSLQEVADITGLSVSYVSKIERGKIPNPSPRAIMLIARALDLNPLDLMRMADGNGEDESDTPLRQTKAVGKYGAISHAPGPEAVRPTFSPGAVLDKIPRLVHQGTGRANGMEEDTAVQEAYGDVAKAYRLLGHSLCNSERYQEGLTAYQLAEAAALQSGQMASVLSVRYEIARLYYTLIRMGQVPEEEQLAYLFRAVRFVGSDSIPLDYGLREGTSGKRPALRDMEPSQYRLGPAASAVSAILYRMILRRFHSPNYLSTTLLEGEYGAEYIALREIIREKRRQANTGYDHLLALRGDEEKTEPIPIGEFRDWAHVVYCRDYASLLFYKALNLRGVARDAAELGEPELRDYDIPVTLLRQAVEAQWHCAHACANTVGTLGSPPYSLSLDTAKADLARYHMELGETYFMRARWHHKEQTGRLSDSSVPFVESVDDYAAALWHFELCRRITLLPDRYVKGDVDIDRRLREVSSWAQNRFERAVQDEAVRGVHELIAKISREDFIAIRYPWAAREGHL